MSGLLILMIVALLFSAVGFKKYVWFISIGYGFSVAAIGAALLIMFRGGTGTGTLAAVLFIIYGCRLGGYLAFREMKSVSYSKAMKGEIRDGSTIGMGAKVAIWISASALYVCETSPVLFRLADGRGVDGFGIVGVIISLCGIVLESCADWQKNKAKKKNPHRFVDSGLFRFVRCPNYLGEMTFWTGVFVSGLNVYNGALQWILAVAGYAGIIYVMFGGARRLEIRQNKRYGNDPAYQAYVKSTPIMVPFIPLYSVEKYKWLVG